jgi:hypothetical protein
MMSSSAVFTTVWYALPPRGVQCLGESAPGACGAALLSQQMGGGEGGAGGGGVQAGNGCTRQHARRNGGGGEGSEDVGVTKLERVSAQCTRPGRRGPRPPRQLRAGARQRGACTHEMGSSSAAGRGGGRRQRRQARAHAHGGGGGGMASPVSQSACPAGGRGVSSGERPVAPLLFLIAIPPQHWPARRRGRRVFAHSRADGRPAAPCSPSPSGLPAPGPPAAPQAEGAQRVGEGGVAAWAGPSLTQRPWRWRTGSQRRR